MTVVSKNLLMGRNVLMECFFMYVNFGTVRALEFLLLQESSFFFVTVSSHWTHRSLIVHFSHDSSWPLSSPCDIQIEWNLLIPSSGSARFPSLASKYIQVILFCEINIICCRRHLFWGQRHFMFVPLSQNCSKCIFLQVKNDSSIRTIRLFVIWHFLGFRICQIRPDTIVSDVRQQFRAWVRDLFWQQSDWPIHRILKRVI